MNQTVKSAIGMMHLLGCALYARPNMAKDAEEARRYLKRLFNNVAKSGRTSLDPEAFKTTEAGKQLREAALLRVKMGYVQPDPGVESFDKAYNGWLDQVILNAAGLQQAYENEQR